MEFLEKDSNYQDLAQFLETFFIPKYVRMFRRISDNKLFPFVSINSINKLNLGEEKRSFILNYLNKRDIGIRELDEKKDREYAYISNPKNEEQEKSRVDVLEYLETRNPKLREDLIMEYKDYATYLGWKYALIFNSDPEEIISAALEGLIVGVDTYKKEDGKFYLFVRNTITNYIKKEIANLSNGATFHFFEILLKYKERFIKESVDGHEPTTEELIEFFCNTKKTLYTDPTLYNFETMSAIFPESYETLEDTAKTTIDDPLFNDIALKQLTLEIQKRLDKLPERQKEVLYRRYGFNTEESLSQTQTGELMGITKTRVGQIERSALWKLRRSEIMKKLLNGYEEELENSRSKPKHL